LLRVPLTNQGGYVVLGLSIFLFKFKVKYVFGPYKYTKFSF